MNNFGGDWTYQKINIVEKYAKAYLTVMKDKSYWKLMYFDGFAGSGEIEINGKLSSKSIDGAATKILNLQAARPFDMYYFVELNREKASKLKEAIETLKLSGIAYVSENDCNEKLKKLAQFLKGEIGKGGRDFKVLAFIDPCGMEVEWESLKELKGLGIDMWILVPTGLGVNRLLIKSGIIPEAWLSRLETFFGIPRELVLKTFYTEEKTINLFGEETTTIIKDEKAIKKIETLYRSRLQEIFNYISMPYVLKNSHNSTMFHFVLASNNKTAINIADEVIMKIYKGNG